MRSTPFRLLLIGFLLTRFLIVADAQCEIPGGGLIINEVGNRSDQDTNPATGEFVELLVTGADSSHPVNVSGLILDDNHSASANVGSTPGHVRLGDCFSAVMPGSLILIYDDLRGFPGIDPSQDGIPNAAGVYQIPFSSPCLIKYPDCPAAGSSIYCGTLSDQALVSTDWRDYLHLEDMTDVVQVRSSKDGLLHALLWWPSGHEGGTSQPKSTDLYPDFGHTNAVYIRNGSAEWTDFAYDGSDWREAGDYVIQANSYSPGVPNSIANDSLIIVSQFTVCLGDSLLLGCATDNPDHCYVWEPAERVSDPQSRQTFVHPLGPTNFRRTTLDGDGNIVSAINYSVRTIGFSLTIESLLIGTGNCPEATSYTLTAEPSEPGNYTYAWSTGEQTPSITVGGEAATYQVTLTNEQGCSRETQKIINPTSVAGAYAEISATAEYLCAGASVDLTASVTEFIGSGNFSYQWNTGATSQTITVGAAGDYAVTISSSDGCSFTDEISLGEGIDFSLTASLPQACVTSPATLAASITAGDGTPFQYAWSTGATSSQISVTTGEIYSLTITDAYGCSQTKSITVADAIDFGISATAAVICANDPVTLSADVLSGAAPYSYNWSTGAQTETIEVDTAGTYRLTLTDAYGCSLTDTLTIEGGLDFTIAAEAATLCYGAETTLRVDLLAPGGGGPYTYRWDDIDFFGWFGTYLGTDSTLTVDEAGTYYLEITDAAGCSVVREITVAAGVDFTLDNAFVTVCSDKPATVAVEIDPASDTGPYQYAWSTGESTASITLSEPVSFSVTVTDDYGCVRERSAYLKPPRDFTLTADANAVCSDEAVTLTATVTNPNSFGQYDFEWSTGEITTTANSGARTGSISVAQAGEYSVRLYTGNVCFVEHTVTIDSAATITLISDRPGACPDRPAELAVPIGGNGQVASYAWSTGATTPQLVVTDGGTYSVTVTDTNGCDGTATITLGSGVDFALAQQNPLTCYDAPTELYPVWSQTGAAPYTYQWNTGQTDAAIAVTANGRTYRLKITDAAGCVAEDSLTVNELTPLEWTLVNTPAGDSTSSDATAEVFTAGGTPPYTFQWNTGATTAQLTGLMPGAYAVTVQDANGCTGTDSTYVYPVAAAVCAGMQVDIRFREPDCETYGAGELDLWITDGFEPTGYLWSTGEITERIAITTGNQTYSVTVTAASGCARVASLAIPDFSPPAATATVTDLCDWADHLEVISLAETQAILVFAGLSSAAIDSALATAPNYSLSLAAEYEGVDGPVRNVLPFITAGQPVPDPTTWAGDLYAIQPDRPIRIRMQMSDGANCPTLCTAERTLWTTAVADTVEVVEEETPPIELIGYECGDVFVPDSTVNTTLLTTLSTDELIYVHGFPILLTELFNTSSPAGEYAGTGIVPLPFSNRTVNVYFDRIVVNTAHRVIEGSVFGVSDDLTNYPDFSIDTLSVGGDICLPPPPAPGYGTDGLDTLSGLDPWGFDANGIHSGTGTEYDPNGFDANGIHLDTQNSYNEAGCSRDSLDVQGNFCDPRPVNAEALAFLDSIEAELPTLIDAVLLTVQDEWQDSLALQAAQCADIRTTMNGLVGQLGFDRTYLFGENDEYFVKGMHVRFASKPQELLVGVPRNAQVEALEAEHVALYGCDLGEVRLEALLDSLANGGSDAALLAYIADRISRLSEAEVDAFDDPAVFQAWLLRQIEAYLAIDSADTAIGFRDERQNDPANLYLPARHRFRNLGTYASTDHVAITADERASLLAELNFQFRQGSREIEGVHRAFFLEEIGRLQEEVMNEGNQNLLPIQISKYIGGYKYTIYLDQIIFSPAGATLDAYLILEDPESGRRLVFEVYNAAFGPGGLLDESHLVLASTVEIRLNNAAKLILSGGGTYAGWDCSGFAGMGISGQIELCRDYITPLDPVTLNPLPDPERYRLDFGVFVPEWLDVVVGVNAGPFAITGQEDIKWQLNNMLIDLSDRETPDFIPTEGYASPYYTGEGLSPLWRGFYLENLSATLPGDLNGADSTDVDPLTFGVEDVLIDGTGFSGEIYVEGLNILDISEGSAGGWPFSIDRFNLKVLHNRLAGGGFGGELNVPIFEGNMAYEATIYPHNRYTFAVSSDSTLYVDMLLAEAALSPNTSVELAYDDGSFLAVANLCGSLYFAVPESNSLSLTLPDVHFTEFQVSNRDPYFEAGTWSIENAGFNLDFGGFGLDVANIAPYQGSSTREAGLGFDISVSLTEALGLSAGGSFGILGELEETNGRQKWKFNKIDIRGLSIDQEIKETVHVKGALLWYEDDPEYGKGFQGLLSADFKKLEFSAQAAAQFGKLDTTEYFFVDVLVNLGMGIGTGVLNINGFGGGVSYHMNNDFTAASINFANAGSANSMPEIGTSFSGVRYTVDPTVGLGLKATALIATSNDRLFNGSVTLEFLFNAQQYGGGLHSIGLKGQGQFLADVGFDIPPVFNGGQELAPSLSGPLTAWIDIGYNFNERTFDGQMETYLDLGILHGIGPGNRLCWADLHVGSDGWYVNIGTPTDPCGMAVNLPIVNTTSRAYFNMGTSIPDFPGLPSNVASLAHRVRTNEGLRKSGGGLMFGASIDLKAELKAGPVNGFLNANFGYDLMLRDYGDAVCSQSGEPVGLNGWYAAGQAWAYLNGGVKVFGFPVFEAGIAAVLQARLPNPIWAQATLAARVKLLFVEKTVNIPLEIGELCTPVDETGNETAVGMPLVNYLNPLDGAATVPTDEQPEIYFAVALDKNFVLPDDQGQDRTYHAEYTDLSLRSLNGGYELPFRTEWLNNDRTALRLIPHRMLPAEDSIRLSVTVTVYENGTSVGTETRTTTFATAAAYDYVPPGNVAYSYPVAGQYDFYPREYQLERGFIRLVSGQSELFNDLPAGEENKVKLTDAAGAVTWLDLTYDAYEREIGFELPADQLSAGTIYALSLVRRSATGDERELLAPFYFRVSEQATFLEKLALLQSAPTGLCPSFGGVGCIQKQLSGNRLLGDVGRLGRGTDQPLVRFRARTYGSWYDDLRDLIYDRFPLEPNAGECGTFDYRGTGPFDDLRDAAGVADFSGGTSELYLTADHYAAGVIAPGNYQQRLRYDVPQAAYAHYTALQEQVNGCLDQLWAQAEPGYEISETLLRNQLGSAAYDFSEQAFPTAPAGTYTLQVQYLLPNGTRTTEATLGIDYQPVGGLN